MLSTLVNGEKKILTWHFLILLVAVALNCQNAPNLKTHNYNGQKCEHWLPLAIYILFYRC